MAEVRTMKEMMAEGYSRRELTEAAHSEANKKYRFAYGTGDKKPQWHFRLKEWGEYLDAKAIGLVMLLLILFSPIAPTKAEDVLITGETALGGISKVMDDYFNAGGKYFELYDLEVLSAAMQLENGCNSDECLLWTGSVILNRVNHWYYPDTIEEVILDGYGTKSQQYASKTCKELHTVKVDHRVKELAIKLLLYGPVAPKEYLFQSMYSTLGKNQVKIDTDYFATW